MLPIVAALAHQLIGKAVARKVGQHFSGKVKQQPPQLPHLELERVELSVADQRRVPAREVLRRLQESIADGSRASQRLAESRSQAEPLHPDELHALQSQASQLNDELESLSQLVGQSLAALSHQKIPA